MGRFEDYRAQAEGTGPAPGGSPSFDGSNRFRQGSGADVPPVADDGYGDSQNQAPLSYDRVVADPAPGRGRRSEVNEYPQSVFNNPRFDNPFRHLLSAKELLTTNGLGAADRQYQAAIAAADRTMKVFGKQIDAERRWIKRRLQSVTDPRLRRELLQRDEDLHDLERAPGAARANQALAYIRNGRKEAGMALLKIAASKDPEMQGDPNFQRHFRDAIEEASQQAQSHREYQNPYAPRRQGSPSQSGGERQPAPQPVEVPPAQPRSGDPVPAQRTEDKPQPQAPSDHPPAQPAGDKRQGPPAAERPQPLTIDFTKAPADEMELPSGNNVPGTQGYVEADALLTAANNAFIAAGRKMTPDVAAKYVAAIQAADSLDRKTWAVQMAQQLNSELAVAYPKADQTKVAQLEKEIHDEQVALSAEQKTALQAQLTLLAQNSQSIASLDEQILQKIQALPQATKDQIKAQSDKLKTATTQAEKDAINAAINQLLPADVQALKSQETALIGARANIQAAITKIVPDLVSKENQISQLTANAQPIYEKLKALQAMVDSSAMARFMYANALAVSGTAQDKAQAQTELNEVRRLYPSFLQTDDQFQKAFVELAATVGYTVPKTAGVQPAATGADHAPAAGVQPAATGADHTPAAGVQPAATGTDHAPAAGVQPAATGTDHAPEAGVQPAATGADHTPAAGSPPAAGGDNSQQRPAQPSDSRVAGNGTPSGQSVAVALPSGNNVPGTATFKEPIGLLDAANQAFVQAGSHMTPDVETKYQAAVDAADALDRKGYIAQQGQADQDKAKQLRSDIQAAVAALKPDKKAEYDKQTALLDQNDTALKALHTQIAQQMSALSPDLLAKLQPLIDQRKQAKSEADKAKIQAEINKLLPKELQDNLQKRDQLQAQTETILNAIQAAAPDVVAKEGDLEKVLTDFQKLEDWNDSSTTVRYTYAQALAMSGTDQDKATARTELDQARRYAPAIVQDDKFKDVAAKVGYTIPQTPAAAPAAANAQPGAGGPKGPQGDGGVNDGTHQRTGQPDATLSPVMNQMLEADGLMKQANDALQQKGFDAAKPLFEQAIASADKIKHDEAETELKKIKDQLGKLDQTKDKDEYDALVKRAVAIAPMEIAPANYRLAFAIAQNNAGDPTAAKEILTNYFATKTDVAKAAADDVKFKAVLKLIDQNIAARAGNKEAKITQITDDNIKKTAVPLAIADSYLSHAQSAVDMEQANNNKSAEVEWNVALAKIDDMDLKGAQRQLAQISALVKDPSTSQDDRNKLFDQEQSTKAELSRIENLRFLAADFFRATGRCDRATQIINQMLDMDSDLSKNPKFKQLAEAVHNGTKGFLERNLDHLKGMSQGILSDISAGGTAAGISYLMRGKSALFKIPLALLAAGVAKHETSEALASAYGNGKHDTWGNDMMYGMFDAGAVLVGDGLINKPLTAMAERNYTVGALQERMALGLLSNEELAVARSTGVSLTDAVLSKGALSSTALSGLEGKLASGQISHEELVELLKGGATTGSKKIDTFLARKALTGQGLSHDELVALTKDPTLTDASTRSVLQGRIDAAPTFTHDELVAVLKSGGVTDSTKLAMLGGRSDTGEVDIVRKILSNQVSAAEHVSTLEGRSGAFGLKTVSEILGKEAQAGKPFTETTLKEILQKGGVTDPAKLALVEGKTSAEGVKIVMGLLHDHLAAGGTLSKEALREMLVTAGIKNTGRLALFEGKQGFKGLKVVSALLKEQAVGTGAVEDLTLRQSTNAGIQNSTGLRKLGAYANKPVQFAWRRLRNLASESYHGLGSLPMAPIAPFANPLKAHPWLGLEARMMARRFVIDGTSIAAATGIMQLPHEVKRIGTVDGSTHKKVTAWDAVGSLAINDVIAGYFVGGGIMANARYWLGDVLAGHSGDMAEYNSLKPPEPVAPPVPEAGRFARVGYRFNQAWQPARWVGYGLERGAQGISDFGTGLGTRLGRMPAVGPLGEALAVTGTLDCNLIRQQYGNAGLWSFLGSLHGGEIGLDEAKLKQMQTPLTDADPAEVKVARFKRMKESEAAAARLESQQQAQPPATASSTPTGHSEAPTPPGNVESPAAPAASPSPAAAASPEVSPSPAAAASPEASPTPAAPAAQKPDDGSDVSIGLPKV